MARLGTLSLASNLTPILDTGSYNLPMKVTNPITGTGSAIGDFVTLATIGRAGRTTKAKLEVSGTLGAAATIQLVVTRAGAFFANLTTASVAAGASVVSGVTLANVDVLAGDLIEYLVAGGATGTAALIKADVQLQH